MGDRVTETARERRRKAAATTVALLLHGAVALAFFFGNSPDPQASVATDAIESPEIDVVVEAPLPPAESPPVDPSTSAEQPAMRTREAAVERSLVASNEQGVAPEPNAESASEPAAPAPAEAPIAIARPALPIGAIYANPFLPRSQAAVERAEGKRAVDHAMKDPARERERELGLGPEGPVITALGDATWRSLAPVRGRATFVVTAEQTGVVGLELFSEEGGRAGWADAARIARDALAGKKLRLPPNVRRAVMKIEVTSAWKLPSGQDPGADVSVFGIGVKKGEGKDSPKVSILDPIPKLRVVELAKDIKVPVLVLQIDLFSTNSDPSNIGAKAQRVIHAHSVDTQLM